MGNADDVELAAGVEKMKYHMDVRTWPLLCLLISLLASIVGYVQYFTLPHTFHADPHGMEGIQADSTWTL